MEFKSNTEADEYITSLRDALKQKGHLRAAEFLRYILDGAGVATSGEYCTMMAGELREFIFKHGENLTSAEKEQVRAAVSAFAKAVNMTMGCECGSVSRTDDFNDPCDYSNLKKSLSQTALKKIAMGKPYDSMGVYQEEWYQCADCKAIWRLVRPDYPFPGVWHRT